MPRQMKRPTQTALKTALYSLMASRDTIQAAAPDSPLAGLSEDVIREISRGTAARAMLGVMGLTATPENLKDALVEVTRACIITGVGL